MLAGLEHDTAGNTDTENTRLTVTPVLPLFGRPLICQVSRNCAEISHKTKLQSVPGNTYLTLERFWHHNLLLALTFSHLFFFPVPGKLDQFDSFGAKVARRLAKVPRGKFDPAIVPLNLLIECTEGCDDLVNRAHVALQPTG